MNPEWLRNYWLEMTPFRWFMMPIILGTIFVGVGASTNTDFEVISGAAAILSYLIGWMWATRTVARSVVQEVKLGTWDYQRMSDIGAWRMAWGKIFGASLFPLYGVIICLSVKYWADMELYKEAPVSDNLPLPIISILKYLAAMLVAHFTAFSMSLVWLQKDRTAKTVRFVTCVVAGVSLGVAINTLHNFSGSTVDKTIMSAMATSDAATSQMLAYLKMQLNPSFYGLSFDDIAFHLVSLGFMVFWGMMGAYRLLRRELQYRVWPFIWPIFILCVVGYLGGYFSFVVEAFVSMGLGNGLHLWFWLALVVFTCLFWVSIFIEPKDEVRYSWLFVNIKKRDWGEILRLMPIWVIPLIMLWVLVVVMITHLYISIGHVPYPFNEAWGFATMADMTAFLLAVILFLMRDLFMVHAMGFLPKAWRPDILSFVLILVIYVLLPTALSELGLDNIRFILHPNGTDIAFMAIVPAILEIIIFAGIIRYRWTIVQKGRKTRERIEEEKFGLVEADVENL